MIATSALPTAGRCIDWARMAGIASGIPSMEPAIAGARKTDPNQPILRSPAIAPPISGKSTQSRETEAATSAEARLGPSARSNSAIRPTSILGIFMYLVSPCRQIGTCAKRTTRPETVVGAGSAHEFLLSNAVLGWTLPSETAKSGLDAAYCHARRSPGGHGPYRS